MTVTLEVNKQTCFLPFGLEIQYSIMYFHFLDKKFSIICWHPKPNVKSTHGSNPTVIVERVIDLN